MAHATKCCPIKKTRFSNIVCIQSYDDSDWDEALTATFTGDIDGSDNWAEICRVDLDASFEDVVYEKYPIFHFANTYGITTDLRGTDYETGWYVPSIAELCEVYKNRNVIATSIKQANGNGFPRGAWYWSSSISDYDKYSVYAVLFYNGGISAYNERYQKLEVFVLHDLKAD